MKMSEAKLSIRLESWRSMVHECQSSGLSVRTWCEENGVKTNQYYYALRQLREKALEKVEFGLPELVEVPVPAAQVREAIRITCGMFQIEIPSGTSAEAIAEVLKAVQASAL